MGIMTDAEVSEIFSIKLIGMVPSVKALTTSITYLETCPYQGPKCSASNTREASFSAECNM